MMQHHARANFSASKLCYSNEEERIGGTSQGNSILGTICRDASYLMFKHLELQNLGGKIKIVRA